MFGFLGLAARCVGSLKSLKGCEHWIDESETEQLMAMVGGHPYLVSLAFYYLRHGKLTWKELLQAAPTPAGIYSSHLRNLLVMLQDEPQLVSAWQG